MSAAEHCDACGNPLKLPLKIRKWKAANHVIKTMMGGQERAFGKTADQWMEMLEEKLVDLRHELLVGLISEHYITDIEKINNALQEHVRNHASEWLATNHWNAEFDHEEITGGGFF